MAKANDRLRRARPLLGTFVEIEVSGATRSAMDAAIDAGFAAVARVHALMSFHAADSDVSRLNREAHSQPVAVDAWTFRVLEMAVELNRASNGAFDIAVAPQLEAMGLLPREAGVPAAAPDLRFFDAVELMPDQAVRFRVPGVRIDLGGIAKGFAVDCACEAMRRFDIIGGMVNAGGDLAAFGREAHTVHVRDPHDPRRLICSIDICDEALASTALRLDRLQSPPAAPSAVMDPETGRPVHAILGATVRAPSCMIADALTKIVMIRGVDSGGLLEYYRAGALLITAQRDVQITPNLNHVVRFAA
jgi:thiamine biosynthesis lipoprotein